MASSFFLDPALSFHSLPVTVQNSSSPDVSQRKFSLFADTISSRPVNYSDYSSKPETSLKGSAPHPGLSPVLNYSVCLEQAASPSELIADLAYYDGDVCHFFC